MLQHEKKAKIIEWLFAFGVILYAAYYYMYIFFYWKLEKNPTEMLDLKRCLYIAIMCIVCKILITIREYTRIELLFAIMGFILLFFCWKNSGSIDFILNFLLLLGMKNVDAKKVIKAIFYVGITCSIYGLIVTLSTNPDSISVIRDFGRGEVERRFRFSTWHANTAQLMFSALITMFLYVYYQSCNWIIYIGIFCLNYGFFRLTHSRTGFITGAIAIVLFFVLRYARRIFRFKIMLIFFEMMNLVLILGSIYFGFISKMDSKWYMLIDQLITGRLSVLKQCIVESGYHLFGSVMGGKVCGYGVFIQPVPGYVTELGIPRMLLEYGPVILAGVALMIIGATWRLHKVDDFEGVIALGIFLLELSVEAYYPAAYNLLPIIMGTALLQNTKRGKERNEKNELDSD